MSFEKEDNIRKVETVEDKTVEDKTVEDKTIEDETVEDESSNRYKVKSNFNVMSIEKTTTPEGMDGDNWYKYIIGKGTSEIQGLKMGTLTEVTSHANNVANDLNDRSKGKKTSNIINKKKPTPSPA